MRRTIPSIAFALCVALPVAPLPGQETQTLLRWKNGDVLPGTLLDSHSGRIHWSSPQFADPLIVDATVLESIVFFPQPVATTGVFRVATVDGAVFPANLVAADRNSFLFSNSRFGKLRVDRDAIYALSRRAHPNLAFDGAQFRDWQLAREGAIQNLSYKVYQGEWDRDDPFPDFSKLVPVDAGSLSAGYLDLGLSRIKERFGMLFEGVIAFEKDGTYEFDLTADDRARVFLDGKLIVDDQRRVWKVNLKAGRHALRTEYLDFGGRADLRLWCSGPGFTDRSLVKTNAASGWRSGPGGHARTDLRKASIFRAVQMPKRFQIDLEFSSSELPQFVLAVGKDKLSAESNRSLRLETWDNELVVVQDKVFEPVLTIAKDQHHVRLSLVFDSDQRKLDVRDAGGRSLVSVGGVEPTTGESGIYIRNRGQDLTVRRLRVSRDATPGPPPAIDTQRPRVHLTDGSVLYGDLLVVQDQAFVANVGGKRQKIALETVDRIGTPQVALTAGIQTSDTAALHYLDGAVLRGRIENANARHVVLRTQFSSTPVTCALNGALSLRLGTAVPGRNSEPSASEGPEGENYDQLLSRTGSLRGRLLFTAVKPTLRWQLVGADKAVRILQTAKATVERHQQPAEQKLQVDADAFPQLLHLKNAEVIPCRVVAHDKQRLEFRSPFLEGSFVESSHVKAIEFNLRAAEHRSVRQRLRYDTGKTPGIVSQIVDFVAESVDEDERLTRLAHALTVPRFGRENPPSHILEANNGDLKRGQLLSIIGQTLQFESKLRKFSVPTERLARVVRAGELEREGDQDAAQPDQTPNGIPRKTIRVKMTDGSLFIFEPLETRDGQLRGQSSIYGKLSLPIEHIARLNFGEFADDTFDSAFRHWTLRPGREPEFEDASP